MRRAAVALLFAAGCASATSDEARARLRERVTGYLEALRAGSYASAYEDYWKNRIRPVNEIEGLLAAQWSLSGSLLRFEIQSLEPSSDGSARVSVVAVFEDSAAGEATERIVPMHWRWTYAKGDWFFVGDTDPR